MLDTGFPFFLMIGYRGWHAGEPMTDSAGIYTEPVLQAWGIPYYLVEDDRDPAPHRAGQSGGAGGQQAGRGADRTRVPLRAGGPHPPAPSPPSGEGESVEGGDTGHLARG